MHVSLFFPFKNNFKTRPTVNYLKPDLKPWNAPNDILERLINKKKENTTLCKSNFKDNTFHFICACVDQTQILLHLFSLMVIENETHSYTGPIFTSFECNFFLIRFFFLSSYSQNPSDLILSSQHLL